MKLIKPLFNPEIYEQMVDLDALEDYWFDKNNESDDDKEPDPRINFEQINRVNKSRPQTSYGGLNVRRKNLQSAFKNRNSRPATSNIS